MSTSAKTCRGIYREFDHSPGRVDDDRAIMKVSRGGFGGAGL